MHVSPAQTLREVLRDGQDYFTLAAVQLAASTAFAGGLCAAFGYPAAAALLHFAYVLGFLGIQTLVLGIAVRMLLPVSPAAARLFLALMVGGLGAGLLVIYAADTISNLAWHTNIDHALLIRANAHLVGVAAAVRLPVFLLYLALALLLATCCAGVYPFTASVAVALQRLLSDDCAGGLLRTRTRALCTLLWSLGFPAYLSFQSVLLFAPGAGAAWRGEVISSLLLDEGVRRFRDQPHLLQASLLDVPVRARYKPRDLSGFPNVILISVDSLRPLSTQVYGYERGTTPFLLELQQAGRLTRVDFATSTCGDSLCGILSMLSARRFNNITYALFKLNDLLHQIGYRTELILSGDHTWQDIRGLLGQSFDYFTDGYGSVRHSINDDRALLEKLTARPAFDGHPTFFFFHLMSAHGIGSKLEYDELWHDEHRRAAWATLRTDGARRDRRVQTYDERVLQADGVLEQMFQILEAKGFLRRTIVVITADHGEALGEHGAWGHGLGLYQANLRIPLLIYDTADGAHYANTAFGNQVDIGPTLLARLGLPVPETWQGRSLLEPPERSYTYHQTHMEPWRFAVIRGEPGRIYKLLVAPDNQDPNYRPEQLFDLVRDPGETTDLLASAAPELVRDLREHLEEYRSAERVR